MGVKALKAIGLVAIFFGLTYSFATNGFAVAPWGDWSGWERGSEAMVLKRIEADLTNTPTPALGLAMWEATDFSVYDRLAADPLRESGPPPEPFVAYESELGGQAYLWSFLWRDVGCSTVACTHVLSSALSAAAVIAMFLAFGLIGAPGLGWAWLASAAASPWITYAARNLFWSPWLYFLPALAAVGLVLAKSRLWRAIACAGVFVAFVIKYVGTGYHEFTAFTMLAASMPLIALVFAPASDVGRRRGQVTNSLLVLVSSALAMATVLVAHAYVLAGGISAGLNQIWVNTVLRRTYGAASNFDPEFAASLNSNPFEVVWQYVWSAWSTDVLSFSVDKSGSVFSLGLGRVTFVLLIATCLAVIARRFAKSDALWKRDASLLALGFAIPAFWFVAAKGYSYVHVHILFFLWYFLFIPALLFIVASFGWQSRQQVWGWINRGVHAN